MRVPGKVVDSVILKNQVVMIGLEPLHHVSIDGVYDEGIVNSAIRKVKAKTLEVPARVLLHEVLVSVNLSSVPVGCRP